MNRNVEIFKIKLLDLLDVKDEDEMYKRINGLDCGTYTMIGLRRLDNIEYCVNTILDKGIKGDFIECGVWKGGACMLMAYILKERNEKRNIYLADVFDGVFPESDHPLDSWSKEHDFSVLSVNDSDVWFNFYQHDLHENINIIKGYFSDTLPKLQTDISLLRIDGDMYKSTMDTLVNLYPKVVRGGFIIIDDWSLESCKNAVLTYLWSIEGVSPDITPIDVCGAYFRKP